MDEKVTVTVGIVSYHNLEDVTEAVEKIEKYTDKTLSKRIYIIDNADDVEGFTEFAEQYDDVSYIHTGENLGFGKGHNIVLDKIDSDYHAIINPDVFFLEDSLSKIIEFMNQDETIGLCIPKLVDKNGARHNVYRREITIVDLLVRIFFSKICKKRLDYHIMKDHDFTKSFHVPFAQGSFMVVRTELLKKLGGFDDRFFMYLEDADLCKRINEISDVRYFPGTTAFHRWERGSHKSFKLFRIHMRSMWLYMKKWGFRWS